ncbi:hypothetical protein Agub_g1102 [Astrephomene gubernaculifera]|uniref:Uncharacterized protein n=1 Tax=Astrephomene gubernaculifera TaxID=47775 RepID=A0AAD3DID1_9CHLO|nr:hypothetical protein Agub_g1102 [Astrephomene gubernaculifera]
MAYRLGLHAGVVTPCSLQQARRACALPACRLPRGEPGPFSAPSIPAATRSANSSCRSAIVAAAATSAPGSPSEQASSGLVASVPYIEADYVEVGRVLGAHGVRGELRLQADTDEPGLRFSAGGRLFLLPPAPQGLAGRAAAAQQRSLIPVTSRGGKSRPLGGGDEMWMVALKEVADRTQAEQLKGCVVLCAAADRAPLRHPDEFYVSDLVGCVVREQSSGRLVGQVVDVFSGMGSHDTLRVKLRASEQDILKSRIRYCLVPFARAICPVVDLPGRTLHVSPPEGLLELAAEEPLKKPLSDAMKAQKLAELRESLRREEEELRLQRGEGQHAPAASPAEAVEARDREDSPRGGEGNAGKVVGSSASGGEDVEDGEGEGEEDEEVQAVARQPTRGRRLGLRRRTGALRLGRRQP